MTPSSRERTSAHWSQRRVSGENGGCVVDGEDAHSVTGRLARAGDVRGQDEIGYVAAARD